MDNKKGRKIVLCGGGTAGHIIPNIALLPDLRKHFDEIHYIGTNGMEKELLKDYSDVKFHEITAVKLVRALTLKNLKIPFVLTKAVRQARRVLNEIQPDVIFSKGGYVAVPVVLASRKTPVVGHESDITMGLANKIIYHKCKKMCFSFEKTSKKYKTKGVFTGSPIREEISRGNKNNLNLQFDARKTILIMGGSLGAKALNDFVDENFERLIAKYNIIHISGKNYTQKHKHKHYVCFQYVKKIEDCFDACDIVVSRSGSNAIFEFLTTAKPMLLVPLPKTSSRGDQILNAKEFERKGLAKVVLQEDMTIDKILDELNDIETNYNKYKNKLISEQKSVGNSKIIKTILNQIV